MKPEPHLTSESLSSKFPSSKLISPKSVFALALTAALSGFLFGFDTIVINGAEQDIQRLWSLSSTLHGFVVSAALWGTVLGAFCGGFLTERYGRKRILIAIASLYVISALWSAGATGPYLMMIARFVGGLGVGISTVAAPAYISEISPARSRGRLVALFQFNIVLGIVIAFASNYLISIADFGEDAWRWMLGVEAIPGIVFMIACFGLVESPRWLIARKGNDEKGREIFRAINPDMSEEQIGDLVSEIQTHRTIESKEPFFSKPLFTPISLAFFIAFFNQLSGINAILYFAKRIFEMAGLGGQSALLQSIGIGATNLLATFVGLWLIDRLGRRTLLYLGGIGYVLSLGLCSWGFYSGHEAYIPICLFLFIAAHAIGQGTVIWVFISEIFPNRHRAAGQALGSFTHWIFAALLTLFFVKAAETFSPGTIFAFFCVMMIVQLIWIKYFVPETKGKTLEDINLN